MACAISCVHPEYVISSAPGNQSSTSLKMQLFNFVTSVGLLVCLSSICSAAVVPSTPQLITIANPDDNPATLPSGLNSSLTYDPDIQTSGHYLPGTLPRNALLALMVKASGALANLDRNTAFRGTVFRPTDPNFGGVEISIVPVLPATELTAGSALYAMYNICYKVRSFPLKRCKMTGRADRAKMLTTNNLKPSVWNMSLDGTRIALITFVNPATPAVETGASAGDNQTLSLAPLPDAVTITDVLQVNSSAGTLTASDF